MVILWVLAASMALRADAPALTPAQARAMPPALLGDALLAAGHPVIVKARIGVQGFVPLPLPGMLLQAPIMLFAAAEADIETGFCERNVAHILLAPVVNAGDATPAAAPVRIEIETTYRWMADRRDTAACAGRDAIYFSVQTADRERAFTLIRALAELQTRIRSGLKSGVEISIDDQLSSQLRQFATVNTDPRIQPTIEQMTPIVDPETALRALPLAQISDIIFGRQSWHDALKGPVLIGKGNSERTIISLFAGNEWTADIALDGAAIAAIAIVREIPPPP